MASWLTLVPGDTLAVYYSDDKVYHERLALWRLQDAIWYILTPDNDVYPEDLRCAGGDGPTRVKIKDRDFKYWSRVGGPAYRFTSRPTDDEFKQRVREAFRQGLKQQGFDDRWRPSEILNMKGVRLAPGDFLGGLLVVNNRVRLPRLPQVSRRDGGFHTLVGPDCPCCPR